MSNATYSPWLTTLFFVGCYSVKKDVDNFYEENYTFSDNSPYICSRKCTTMTSGDFIFLNVSGISIIVHTQHYIYIHNAYHF